MRSRRTLLPDLCLLWLIWQFFVATTGFCVVGMVLVGCSNEPKITHYPSNTSIEMQAFIDNIGKERTAGWMDSRESWKHTMTIVDGRGHFEKYERVQANGIIEYRYFKRVGHQHYIVPVDEGVEW